jgi:hypothetical protein
VVNLWLAAQPTHEHELELFTSTVLWGSLAKLAAVSLFLWWLATVVGLTNALSPRRMPCGPLAAVVSFFVPMVNFFWPCAVLYQLNAALAPSAIPEPLPRAVADPAGGYRDVRWSPLPAPPRLPRVSILAWWCTLCLGTLLRWNAAGTHEDGCPMAEWGASIPASVVDIVAIVLGIAVVRGITARLVERMRRIEHNDEEVVRAAGVVLP